jgi:hypothetical protein
MQAHARHLVLLAVDPRRIDVEDLVASVHHLAQTEVHMASTASLAASQPAA